ncbi:hypothetical protein N7455_003834 [Penicillium solitum]|uniref:uncharacterized protein n=1 Tax=Penicillium solitum TaxID=60172 RepID=UPI0032C3F1B6|nr:hypothetical protein N7455_003834 [Penicillium solitum]
MEYNALSFGPAKLLPDEHLPPSKKPSLFCSPGFGTALGTSNHFCDSPYLQLKPTTTITWLAKASGTFE